MSTSTAMDKQSPTEDKSGQQAAAPEERAERLYQALKLNQHLRKKFSEADIRALVPSFESVEFDSGLHIIRKDDDGDYFYIIDQGECEIFHTQDSRPRLQYPSAFGELSLQHGMKRSCTIVAVSPVRLWRMDKDTYRHKILLEKKKSGGGGDDGSDDESSGDEDESSDEEISISNSDEDEENSDEPSISEFQADELEVVEDAGDLIDAVTKAGQGRDRPRELVLRLTRWCKQSDVALFKRLEDQKLRILCSNLDVITYKTGEYVFHQGEVGQHFYVLYSGAVELVIDDVPKKTFGPGVGFGEMALQCVAVRTGSIRCVEPSAMFVMGKEDFLRSSKKKPKLDRVETKFIDRVKTFTDAEGRTQINNYTVLRLLGKGAFGAVRLVFHNEHSEYYAMKIMDRSTLMRRRFVGRNMQGQDSWANVQKEIQVMKELRHKHIVTLYEVMDDGKNTEKVYLVMEYAEHGPVMPQQPQFPLDPVLQRKYFRHLLLGLEYLHHQGVIHRDIKPENLLIDRHDRLKLADFGVAALFEGEDDFVKKSEGTPFFLPPESYDDEGSPFSGRKADIWACGVTLFMFAYAKVPFRGDTPYETIEKIIAEELQFPVAPTIDSHLKDLLRKMLTKDPDKRITLPELRDHPWVTNDGSWVMPNQLDGMSRIQDIRPMLSRRPTFSLPGPLVKDQSVDSDLDPALASQVAALRAAQSTESKGDFNTAGVPAMGSLPQRSPFLDNSVSVDSATSAGMSGLFLSQTSVDMPPRPGAPAETDASDA